MKKNWLLILFVLSCALYNLSILQAQQNSDGSRDFDSINYLEELKQKYLSDSKSLLIYTGRHELRPGKEVNADVLLLNGDLVIAGTLNGKAVVANGNIILKRDGHITRDAVAINGKVVFSNAAQLAGNIIQLNSRDSDYDGEGNKDLQNEKNQLTEMPELPVMPKKSESVSDNNKKNDDDEIFNGDIEGANRAMNESSKKMKALNERMEKFNRKMKQWNYNITSSGDGYSYSYGERQDSESDKEENRDHSRNSTYDASFVRVTDDDQTNEGNNENSHIQTTDYTRDDYFYKKHPRLVNTSFFAVDYNRVDGVFLGAKLDRQHKMYAGKPFQIYGELGYAFSQKAARFQLGLDKFWGNEFRFSIGGELHDLTATPDDWRIGRLENALNAVLFKNDYADYFRTKGYSLQASQNLNAYLTLSVAYRADNYYSLTNRTNWAIFRPSQDFRINPAIDDGVMHSIVGQVSLNNVSNIQIGNYHSKRVGWNISAEGERSTKSLKSDFQFTRYQLTVTRYQPLSRWENLDVRLMLGTATGQLPLQKTFYLGGISTLRGFGYKEFGGNNMAMANVEYRISSGILHDDRVFFLHPFSAILFMDTGYAWNHPTTTLHKTFAGVSVQDLQTDIGIGIGDEKDLFRVDLAKPVSRKNSAIKVDFRINYAF
jgi:hypothetical protein